MYVHLCRSSGIWSSHLTSDGCNVTGIQRMYICVDLLASGLHILLVMVVMSLEYSVCTFV